MRAACTVLLVALALAPAGCGSGAQADAGQEPLLVGAAADLLPAFEVIGERFRAETGEQVTFVFGSSGHLAQQIIEGAPMDLFASADARLVEEVLAAGRGDPATRAPYAIGRLALWSHAETWGGWTDLTALAADRDVGTIAVANPEHAPYGRAAAQALDGLGLSEALAGRLVYGENVADTQRLAASGNADASIVALSLALAADERGEGRWVAIDPALHAPLRQDLVVVAEDVGRAALAARFVDFIDDEAGREVLRRFGFLLPGELPVEPGDR